MVHEQFRVIMIKIISISILLLLLLLITGCYEDTLIIPLPNNCSCTDISRTYVSYINSLYDIDTGNNSITTDELILSNTVYEDIQMNILISKASSTKPPTLTSFIGGTYALAFENVGLGNEQEVYTSLQMSHSYKLGTNISCHLHWSCGTTSANNVTWALEITKSDLNSIFPTTTTLKKPSSCGTAFNHNIDSFGSIGSFSGLSGVGMVRLYRDSANTTDNFAGNNAFALSLDCHYQKDSLGSNEEYVK
jgi:hypothetical protein